MYIFEFGDLAIVGASPETLMTVHKRKVMINPIAGTCPPRGKSKAEDEALASHMLNDEKERAEHVMLVDLGEKRCPHGLRKRLRKSFRIYESPQVFSCAAHRKYGFGNPEA